MSEPLNLDPDAFRHRGATVREIGERVRQAVEQLRGVLDTQGRPWGDDEAAAEFEKQYLAQADQSVAYAGEVADNLRRLGAQMATGADRYQDVDRLGSAGIETAAHSGAGISGVPGDRQPRGTGSASPMSNAAATVPGTRSVPLESKNSVPQSISSNGPTAPVTPADTAARGTGSPGPGAADRPGDAANGARTGPVADRAADRSDPGAGKAPVGGDDSTPGSHGRQPDRNPLPTIRQPGRPIGDLPADRRSPQNPETRDEQSPRIPGRSTRHGGQARRNTEGHPAKSGSSERARNSRSTGENAMSRWIRLLTGRYGLEVVGFDADGLDESVVAEFVAAIDDVLTRYPAIVLHRVAIAELDGERVVQACRTVADDGSESPCAVLTLDLTTARDSHWSGRHANRSSPNAPDASGGCEQSVYIAAVGQLGRVLDFGHDGLVAATARRTLVAAYLDTLDAEARSAGLGPVVRGYKQWRRGLFGHDVDNAVFDPDTAIAAAFAQVLVNGGMASHPARALYRVLVS